MGELLSGRYVDSNNLAKIAADLFIRVSMQHSASVIQQGAAMALEFQQTDLLPSDLENALLSDKEELSRVMAIANRAHRNNVHRNAPLTEKETVSVIRTDFRWADDLLPVPAEVVKTIFTYKPKFWIPKIADRETMSRVHAARLRRHYTKQKRVGSFY